MRQLLGSLLPLCLALAACWSARGAAEGPPRVLVYTRNGKGYVHDNIAASVAAIRDLGRENGFAVDATDDPEVFADARLRLYRALVFANTNNEAFTGEGQRQAFRRYIQGGGGFVGIHSASGSERQWPYYHAVLGGKFAFHPPFQEFRIRVVDRNHPATAHLPETWTWKDECYFHEDLNPGFRVLLAADVTSLKPRREPFPTYPVNDIPNSFPLAWCQRHDGGREFYTALGHAKEHYADPDLRRHILGGILWAMDAPIPPREEERR